MNTLTIILIGLGLSVCIIFGLLYFSAPKGHKPSLGNGFTFLGGGDGDKGSGNDGATGGDGGAG